MTVTFLQAPKKVSKEGRGDAVASVSFLPLQPLPLALLFPSNSACRRDACVLWGCLHLCLQCQICAFTHQSFLSSVIQPMIMPLSSSRRLDRGEEGTSCLLATQEHKAAAAIAVTKCIKAVISLPLHSPHPETKPLQSPAGNHPSQRHLRSTSLQGCRAEGMIRLYSAIKAFILSFLFPSCGSRQSASLLPISHPHCSALPCLGAPSPLCGATATLSPCPQLL